jgi:probable rRNA maturation factor
VVEVANLTNSKINIKYFQKIGEVVLRKLKQPKDIEVSLVFVCDARMKSLNKKYRGKNKATDVLSFAYNENNFLGEIVISVSTAKKQAIKRSYPLKTELSELFVHGILHLVGYEDETEDDYQRMVKKQEEIWKLLRV